MLTYLKIKNFITISECEIDFKNKLNVITGESGAGKSIIFNAIEHLFGKASNQSFIKANQSFFEIEGYFKFDNKTILSQLAEYQDDDNPTYDAGTSSLVFDGIDDNYMLGSNYIFAETSDGGKTIFIVAEPESSVNGEGYLYYFGAHSGADYHVHLNNNYIEFLASSSHGGDWMKENQTISGTSIITGHVEFSNNQRLFLNGSMISEDAITLTQINGSTLLEGPVRSTNYSSGPISIGMESKFYRPSTVAGGPRTYKGKIKEIIVFTKDLSMDYDPEQKYSNCFYEEKVRASYLRQ